MSGHRCTWPHCWRRDVRLDGLTQDPGSFSCGGGRAGGLDPARGVGLRSGSRHLDRGAEPGEAPPVGVGRRRSHVDTTGDSCSSEASSARPSVAPVQMALSSEVWEFDPATGTWTALEPLPEAVAARPPAPTSPRRSCRGVRNKTSWEKGVGRGNSPSRFFFIWNTIQAIRAESFERVCELWSAQGDQALLQGSGGGRLGKQDGPGPIDQPVLEELGVWKECHGWISTS